MEPPTPPEPQPGLPATRPVPPPVVPQQPRAGWPPALQQPQPPQQPAPRPRFSWRRLTRSPRGAAGLAIVVAALLLWPFAGWSVIPWLAGLGAVVLLRLLRLDKLLRDWDLHLAGLVVIAGLMLSSGPWSWALAASIGVLLAGSAQLPWWKLAAVGAVMCLVSGVGFGITQYQQEQKAVAERQVTSEQNQGQIAEQAGQILRILDQTITGPQADPDLLCSILAPPAEQQLSAAVGAPDCHAATSVLHDRLRGTDTGRPQNSIPPGANQQPPPQTMVLDACQRPWAEAAGPALGKVTIQLVNATQRSYLVSGFGACSAA
jgi:membrane protein YdbS with pleckstrin-like domain